MRAPRQRLFIDVRYGLCNRLRSLVSAAAIAQKTDRKLYVIWNPDDHCGARIGELLDYDGPVIAPEEAERVRACAPLSFNYMPDEADSSHGEVILQDLKAEDGDIYIKSAYPINTPYRDKDLEKTLLRRLRPTQEILDMVESVRRPLDLVAHIRMGFKTDPAQNIYEPAINWSQKRHDEMLSWRSKSHVSAFVKRIDALMKTRDFESIFVASDSSVAYDEIVSRYGEKVRFLKRKTYDRSSDQIKYALADLLLLASGRYFLSSTWSSFSDVAQRISSPGRKFERSGIDF